MKEVHGRLHNRRFLLTVKDVILWLWLSGTDLRQNTPQSFWIGHLILMAVFFIFLDGLLLPLPYSFLAGLHNKLPEHIHNSGRFNFVIEASVSATFHFPEKQHDFRYFQVTVFVHNHGRKHIIVTNFHLVTLHGKLIEIIKLRYQPFLGHIILIGVIDLLKRRKGTEETGYTIALYIHLFP